MLSVPCPCSFPSVFWYILRHKDQRQRAARQAASGCDQRLGHSVAPNVCQSCSSIGVLDGSVRNALLTFVPFLLMAKGVSEVSTSLMLTVIFAGGAVGKLGCGILADKLGTTAMIVLTEVLTGVCLLALLPVDQMLAVALAVLPGILSQWHVLGLARWGR